MSAYISATVENTGYEYDFGKDTKGYRGTPIKSDGAKPWLTISHVFTAMR